MIIIGITGSIGCGKTYLANMIKSLGFSVYNPDVWVHELYTKSSFLKVIEKNFPQTFENGIFNKRILRNCVFGNNKQLQKLESLIHPFLKQKLKSIVHQYAQKNDFLFLDVALLFEMEWHKYCDYVIVADADEQTQKQRVMKRDNVSEEDFAKITAIQIPQQHKKELADYVIDTTMPDGINKVQIIKFMEEIV